MHLEKKMDSIILPLLGDILSVLSSRLPVGEGEGEENLPKYNYPSAGHLYPVQTLVYIPSSHYLGYHHPLNNCLVELPNEGDKILNSLREYTPTIPSSPLTPSQFVPSSPQFSTTPPQFSTTPPQFSTTPPQFSSSPSQFTSSASSPSFPVVMAYLIFVMEREAIEPVYGADLSLDFCYLEAGK